MCNDGVKRPVGDIDTPVLERRYQHHDQKNARRSLALDHRRSR